ncbi:hypothetical protein FOZ61_003673 [Perkinsus olseni]|uniref:Uncharacterized protein n=1 Tax=Perkinsus olseni TaxID=32597 RepID=A0A7J6LNY6_PEROL|nr:hypothetical protein FOZ61_003673 [Perkinsus olseni]KAF4665960.1 hypothetical protein FOL46_003350 [Perkinsus olseni]
MSGFVEEETDDPAGFVAAARRRASKQRRSHDDITTEDRAYDLSRKDVPVVREPADEHLEALARLRASHAPVISPDRERQPVTHAKEQPGVDEADRKRLSPVVVEGLSSADGATKEGDTGHVEDSGSRVNRRINLRCALDTLLSASHMWDGEGSEVSVKHFSRQLRRINAEKQAREKSRPREDDRLSIDARSRGLEFHRRQREGHKMNREARSRRTRKSNSKRLGPKEDQEAAERARLEEMLRQHDCLRAKVDAFRRWLHLGCAFNGNREIRVRHFGRGDDQKQKSSEKALDPTKLEYRLAHPSDVLLDTKVDEDAAVFVAYDTKAKAVVGSVEFGLVKPGSYETHETVYLPWVEVEGGQRNQDVVVEVLKHLLEYIKRVRPQVVFAWTREYWGPKDDFADTVCMTVGFERMGGLKEDEQAAERARLEEMSQRHKQKTLDPSKLEYRLAKPTDVLPSDKLEEKAAVFVAYDTTAQFGVLKEAVYENQETVFLPWLEMIRGWANQDVAVEMLKHLLEYIEGVLRESFSKAPQWHG